MSEKKLAILISCANMTNTRMRVQIKNIAKIKEADVVVDGITVIAGENNTGKSTVGKVLFCIFDALYNLEENIAEQKEDHIEDVFQNFYVSCSRRLERVNGPREIERRRVLQLVEDIRKFIDNNEALSTAEISKYFECVEKKSAEPIFFEKIRHEFAQMREDIVNYLNVSKESIIKEIVDDEFDAAFNSQINSLDANEEKAEVAATIQGKPLRFVFCNDICNSMTLDISLKNKAVLIDDPTILNRLNSLAIWGRRRVERYEACNLWEKRLVNYLLYKRNKGAAERVIQKEKLKGVYAIIQEAINAQIVESEGELVLKEHGLPYSVKFSNLSYGLRAFVVIKMLIERNVIAEKDVLILDEPEIHLHPQWQILFAQLIVLLQKEFNLSIVITTHSPYFVEAIQLYTRRYSSNDKTHFYLSETENRRAVLHDVTGNVEAIYKIMAAPYRVLDEIAATLD